MKNQKKIKVKFVKDEVYPYYDVGSEDYADGEVELPEKFYREFFSLMKKVGRYQDMFEAFVENPRCECGFATFYEDNRKNHDVKTATEEWYECYRCHKMYKNVHDKPEVRENITFSSYSMGGKE